MLGSCVTPIWDLSVNNFLQNKINKRKHGEENEERRKQQDYDDYQLGLASEYF